MGKSSKKKDGFSSDFLRDAVADAKTVRETALENAKIALQEAFTPKLQSMLTDKLQQEVDEEVTVDEELKSSEIGTADNKEPTKTANDTSTVDAEGPHGDGAADEDEDFVPSKYGVEEAIDNDGDVIDEVYEDEEGDEMDYEESDDEEGDDEEVDDEMDYEEEDDLDLESILKELEDGVELEEDQHDDLEPADVKKSHTVDMTELTEDDDYEEDEEDGDMDYDGGDDEEIDIEIEPDDEDDEYDEYEDDEEEVEEMGMDYEEDDMDDYDDDDDVEEEIDLSELFSSLEEDENVVDQTERISELEGSLKEHRKAVRILRNKMNEINVLNAKLLFCNKLFRNFNMDNDSKMKIIENFDRAKNVREIKLVYATLAENLRQHKIIPKSVKRITEGASKVIKSTKPKDDKILTEGAGFEISRIQKLAGIRK